MSMTTELTMEKMEEIRLRYSPKPIPKCRICGAEMSIGAVSASRTVYACSGATHDENGWHYAPGRSLADDHYSESRVTVVDVSDPDVLALLDELEAKDQRIAELEAREVVLPQRYSMLHRVDFDEPYHTEMVYKQHQVLEALHDAGVNVAADAKGAAS